MIAGLKLTIHGEELRMLLEQRMHEHHERASWWKQEEARTPEEQTDDEPLLPDEMCANEAERHQWRADVLGFIRDHIDPVELYRLGEDDLIFGELLPVKPGWLEQQEYEERTSVGFYLGRLNKTIGDRMLWEGPVAGQRADEGPGLASEPVTCLQPQGQQEDESSQQSTHGC